MPQENTFTSSLVSFLSLIVSFPSCMGDEIERKLLCVTLPFCSLPTCSWWWPLLFVCMSCEWYSKLVVTSANPAYEQFTSNSDLKQVKLTGFASSDTSLRDMDFNMFQDYDPSCPSPIQEDDCETSFVRVNDPPQTALTQRQVAKPKMELTGSSRLKDSVVQETSITPRGRPRVDHTIPPPTDTPTLLLPPPPSRGSSPRISKKKFQTEKVLAQQLVVSDEKQSAVLKAATPKTERKTPEQQRTQQTSMSQPPQARYDSSQKVSKKIKKHENHTDKATSHAKSSVTVDKKEPRKVVSPEITIEEPSNSLSTAEASKTGSKVAQIPARQLTKSSKLNTAAASKGFDSSSKTSKTSQQQSTHVSQKAQSEKHIPVGEKDTERKNETSLHAARGGLKPDTVVPTTITPRSRPKVQKNYEGAKTHTPKLKPPPSPRGSSPNRQSKKTVQSGGHHLLVKEGDNADSGTPQAQRYMNFLSEVPGNSPKTKVKTSVSSPEGFPKQKRKESQQTITPSKSYRYDHHRDSQFAEAFQDIDALLASLN